MQTIQPQICFGLHANSMDLTAPTGINRGIAAAGLITLSALTGCDSFRLRETQNQFCAGVRTDILPSIRNSEGVGASFHGRRVAEIHKSAREVEACLDRPVTYGALGVLALLIGARITRNRRLEYETRAGIRNMTQEIGRETTRDMAEWIRRFFR